MTYDCGYQGDGKVFYCDDIDEGCQQCLVVICGRCELAHKQIGIEEEDDEGYFDCGSQMAVFGWVHGLRLAGNGSERLKLRATGAGV